MWISPSIYWMLHITFVVRWSIHITFSLFYFIFFLFIWNDFFLYLSQIIWECFPFGLKSLLCPCCLKFLWFFKILREVCVICWCVVVAYPQYSFTLLFLLFFYLFLEFFFFFTKIIWECFPLFMILRATLIYLSFLLCFCELQTHFYFCLICLLNLFDFNQI